MNKDFDISIFDVDDNDPDWETTTFTLEEFDAWINHLIEKSDKEKETDETKN